MINELLMDNYDDMWLGVGNSTHPYNQETEEEPDFESCNLSECLQYLKDKDDYEPIEFSVQNQEEIIEKSLGIIDFCQDIIAHNDNFVLQQKLQELKKLLKSNQKK